MKKFYLIALTIFSGSLLAKTTTLHEAAIAGDFKRAEEILLTGHVKINEQEVTEGKTALHLAIERGFAHMVDLFIWAGANVNLASNDPINPYPLHLAVVSGHPDIVLQLLEAGAQVNNVANATGKTALHRAAELGMYTVIKHLLRFGTDVNIKDIHDKTALDYAQENNWTHITPLFWAYKNSQRRSLGFIAA